MRKNEENHQHSSMKKRGRFGNVHGISIRGREKDLSKKKASWYFYMKKSRSFEEHVIMVFLYEEKKVV